MTPPNTILVVENDIDTLELIRGILANLHVKVVTAADGVQAMEFLKANALPSLILLDFHMPNMDGFQFRAMQLKEERLRDVPVVFMTAVEQIPAQRDDDDQVRCLKKPFTADDLVSTVRRFVD
jgi:CheY-like chemotaxis protein